MSQTTAEVHDGWTAGATRAANFLASMPLYGHLALTGKDLKSLLLQTDGQLLAQGRLWDIKVESLGAGISRVSLKPKP